jgi:hypothetical protein
VPDPGDDPRGRQPLHGDEGEGQLGRERDEADQLGDGRPLVDAREVDRRELGDRDRTGRLRVQERAFEVQAEAERVFHLPDGTGGEEVPRHARRTEAGGVIDLQVDEPREEERLRRAALPPLDLRDRLALQDERPRERSLDGVDDKSL